VTARDEATMRPLARIRRWIRQHRGIYTTSTGKVLTDADIQALADEAERGYDVEHLRQR